MSNYKFLIILFISFFTIVKTYAQTYDNITMESNYYTLDSFEQTKYDHINTSFDYKNSSEWKKYKTLRTLGWCSIGIGIPTTLVGVLLSSFQNSLYGSGGVGLPCIITGGVLTLSSIPLLICAYHYRKKAINLTVSASYIDVKQHTCPLENFSALSFTISF